MIDLVLEELMIRFAPKTALVLLCLVAGGLGATGCAGIGSTRPATQPSRANWTSERERELARIKITPAGFWIFQIAYMRTDWFFSDLNDRISGSRVRFAEQMGDKTNPDRRREGMMNLVDRPYGEVPPYTTAYAAIARDNSQDYLVRASAIRALNRSRATEFEPIYVEQLGDANENVRMEACKALNRMPDVSAVPKLLQIAARPEENKDVRIAATEALRHYKRLDVARSLVSLLSEREFAIAWQARRSLQDITHKRFGYDEGKWLQYLSKPEKPLS